MTWVKITHMPNKSLCTHSCIRTSYSCCRNLWHNVRLLCLLLVSIVRQCTLAVPLIIMSALYRSQTSHNVHVHDIIGETLIPWHSNRTLRPTNNFTGMLELFCAFGIVPHVAISTWIKLTRLKRHYLPLKAFRNYSIIWRTLFSHWTTLLAYPFGSCDINSIVDYWLKYCHKSR